MKLLVVKLSEPSIAQAEGSLTRQTNLLQLSHAENIFSLMCLNIYAGADRKFWWRNGTPLGQEVHEEMKELKESMKNCILSWLNIMVL